MRSDLENPKIVTKYIISFYSHHLQQSLQIDAMWRGTSLMGLPHASTNLSQAAESPEDVLERNVQDPTFVSL